MDNGLPPDFDPSVREILQAQGVQGRTTKIDGDSVNLEWLKVHCAKQEATLRDQFMDPNDPKGSSRQLPPEWESRLAALPPVNLSKALQRYALIKHFYMVRSEGLAKRSGPATEDAMLAAYRLLRRDPIPVDLGERTVWVTDRSLAALVEIARHESRVRHLWSQVEDVREAKLEASRKIAEGPPLSKADRGTRREIRRYRNRIRKKVDWLFDLEERMLAELQLHRQAMYAHIFTESGAPAKSIDEAPEWWTEITPTGDGLILEAVNRAGAGLYDELGPPPQEPKDPDDKGKWELLEDFGWITAVTRWGIKVPVTPAEYIDRPLGQAATMFRLSRDPVHIKGKR